MLQLKTQGGKWRLGPAPVSLYTSGIGFPLHACVVLPVWCVIACTSRSFSLQMEERLKGNEEQADLYQKRLEAASKTVAELKAGVAAALQRLGAAGAPAARAALGDGGVTDSTVLTAMSLVEQRATEALRVIAGTLQVRAVAACA